MHSNGDFACVFSADLQEPTSLLREYFRILSSGEWDVVLATRKDRKDPFLQKLSAKIFWRSYRVFINRDMPPGGIDSFACSRQVIVVLNQLKESNTSLVGLLCWVGFRRTSTAYSREKRLLGHSGWSFRKKLKYMSDSIFSFSALPLRLIQTVGGIGMSFSFLYSVFLVYHYIKSGSTVPGFTTLILLMLIIYSSTMFAIGILGSYVWRTFQNSQHRPTSIELSRWTSD